MTDVAAVFQVIVGEDPDDPVTAAARGRPRENYAQALQRDGLKGARIGVLRQAYERSTAGPQPAGGTAPRDTTDPEVASVFMKAVADLQSAGAIIVDPATVEGLDADPAAAGHRPVHGLQVRHQSLPRVARRSHPDEEPGRDRRVRAFPSHRCGVSWSRREQGPANGPETPACQAEVAYREQVRAAVLKTMDALKLDAFVYPTWSNPPRLIGDLNSPHGDNSQFFSPTTGFPAIQVPMGYTRGGALPAGITFFGRAWAEATLIKLAYAYEQATHHRRPPASTPPLR